MDKFINDQSNNKDVRKNKISSRKCKNFSMKQKLEILDRLEHEPSSNVIKEINVDATTIRRWKRKRKEFEEVISKDNMVLRKRRRLAENTVVEEALYIWFCQSRRRGIPVSGVILKQRALDLHEKINHEKKFSASDGWLRNWKERYNMKIRTTCSAELPSDETTTGTFIIKLPDSTQLEGIERNQVFNLDGSPSNVKSLPQNRVYRLTVTARSKVIKKLLSDDEIINLAQERCKKLEKNNKGVDTSHKNVVQTVLVNDPLSGSGALDSIEEDPKFENDSELSLDTVVDLHNLKSPIMTIKLDLK